MGDEAACGRSERTAPRRSTDRDDATCLRCRAVIARLAGEEPLVGCPRLTVPSAPWGYQRQHGRIR